MLVLMISMMVSLARARAGSQGDVTLYVSPVPLLQVACTGLREVHSIALVLDSGSSKISWYVEEIMVRTVGEEEWTSFPCFTWLHAGRRREVRMDVPWATAECCLTRSGVRIAGGHE